MKVLMLGWELPPHNSGGLGVACYQLCEELSKNDVDLEFILPYEAEHNINFMKVSAVRTDGIIEIIKAGNAYDSYRYIYQDGRQDEWHNLYEQAEFYEHAVGDMIKGLSFDVVHAHDWLTFRAALKVRALDRNVPIILHVHSIESDRAGGNLGNSLVREIEETAMLAADSVIAVSELTKQKIVKEYNIPAEKIEVIHNSIDTNALDLASSDNAYRYLMQLKQDGYKIVSNVGRITIQKGLTNLIHAARIVCEKLPKIIFLVVGSGDQFNELVGLSAELRIGANVIFAGFQRGKLWRDSFSIADLFVMPSVSEPFGLTPLEAGFYGVPSLVTKQSGVSEVLSNCLVVDFWDVNEMANKIVGVLRSQELHDTLGSAVENELLSLSWEKPARDVKRLYERHIQGAEA
jgi:glycosyltransferase involved in cell wall biosynthesis